MATIAQVQAAAKAAPHYRVTCGALEVIGAPGVSRWSFDYIVRRENGRGAYGKRNAVDYLATLASDAVIVPVTFERKAAPRVAPAIVSTVVTGSHKADIHANGFVELFEAVSENADGSIVWELYSEFFCGTVDAATAHVNQEFCLTNPDAEQASETEEEKRAAMIENNRRRAYALRNRKWSEQALDNRAYHSFALCMDKDGNPSAMRAAAELQTYLRENRHDITNVGAAFRALYGIARDYARAARNGRA